MNREETLACFTACFVHGADADAQLRAERRAALAQDMCVRYGIMVATRQEPTYPQALTRLSQPPELLCMQGNLRLLHAGKRLTIVGTRAPTAWAKQAAEAAAALAASMGCHIVSGLAEGCDTRAHIGALKAGGYTISVEATPLSSVYPAMNRRLVTYLFSRAGCRISARIPGQAIQRYHFVQRDRYQAALGDALLMVEGNLSSGSMYAAREALRLSLPVACLVPQLPLTSGVAWLLAQGAAPIANAAALRNWLNDKSISG